MAKQTKEQTLARLIKRMPILNEIIANAEAMHSEMTAYWGEQCPDFDPECPACKAWAIYRRTGIITE